MEKYLNKYIFTRTKEMIKINIPETTQLSEVFLPNNALTRGHLKFDCVAGYSQLSGCELRHTGDSCVGIEYTNLMRAGGIPKADRMVGQVALASEANGDVPNDENLPRKISVYAEYPSAFL